jgi:CelD/BcsL family acetyltransferase involved in cellulose biosynthesis
MPDDASFAREWNRLVLQMERPEVFYTFQWSRAVTEAHKATITPILAIAYEDDRPIGVASLCQNLRGEISFLAGTTADYCDFISSPVCRTEFVSAVLNELKQLRPRSIVLANLPSDSATNRAITAASLECRYSWFSRPAFECFQVDLSSPERKRAVAESVRRKQMFRRHWKSLSQLGEVSVAHSRAWADISQALPAFRQVHIARFRALQCTSNLESPERQDFLSELARLLSEQGSIVLSCLQVGEQDVAWNYGFTFAGSWFWYQPTFALQYRSHYPGYCLLAKIIEEACDRPDIERVDLGLGDESYKQRFANATRPTLDVTLSDSRISTFKANLRYRTASVIKASPWLETQVRRVLQRPGSRGVQA